MKFTFPWNKSLNENQVYLSYDAHRDNLGDVLSPMIANYFGSKEVKRISKRNCSKFEHYFMIGSILQRCTDKSIIWGSGFLYPDSKCNQEPIKVLAVRGPLTRKLLLEQGIECPEIYGDPALLLPRMYPVEKRNIKFKLGIIPHFRDKEDAWLKKYFLENPDIKIIDVQNKDPFKVIDDMLSCEKIISSSLHGIIISDAYEIPSVWVEFSDLVEGNGFKFRDYFKSVGRKDEKPYQLNQFKNLDEILAIFEDYKISIDLDLLENSFPF